MTIIFIKQRAFFLYRNNAETSTISSKVVKNVWGVSAKINSVTLELTTK